MNELEAKCYLTKQGGANNSDQHCILKKLTNNYVFRLDRLKYEILRCFIFVNKSIYDAEYLENTDRRATLSVITVYFAKKIK